jgi:uncharacterized protein GlcG (DUF336 family)
MGASGYRHDQESKMPYRFSLAFAAAFTMLPLSNASAQIAESAYSLSLALAQKAATTAIASCERKGYRVSAVVVDTSGVVKLEAKGDHSTIHTVATAYRKAYTVITFGPIFRFDSSSAFVELAAKHPALATGPDIAALPGAVAIKEGNEIIAALGISGSPGGDKDEACARDGVSSIGADIARARFYGGS